MSNDFICYNVLMLSARTEITKDRAREIIGLIDAVQEDMDCVRDAIRASGLSDRRQNKEYSSMTFAQEARGDALQAFNALQTVRRWLSWLVQALDMWEEANNG